MWAGVDGYAARTESIEYSNDSYRHFSDWRCIGDRFVSTRAFRFASSSPRCCRGARFIAASYNTLARRTMRRGVVVHRRSGRPAERTGSD